MRSCDTHSCISRKQETVRSDRDRLKPEPEAEMVSPLDDNDAPARIEEMVRESYVFNLSSNPSS